MKYSISIWNFAENPDQVANSIKEFANEGFDCVSLKPENILSCDEPQWNQIREAIFESDVDVTVHGALSMSIVDVRVLISRLKGRLKCLSLDPRCRIDPDGLFFSPERHIPVLEWLRQFSLETPIEFCIEDFPIDQRALSKHAQQLEKIRDCNAFGILLDLGHMNLRLANEAHHSGDSIEQYIRGIPVPIKELHIHDNDATDDRHLPLGRGTIDYQSVVMALRDREFDGYATVELTPQLYGEQPGTQILAAVESMRVFRSLFGDAT